MKERWDVMRKRKQKRLKMAKLWHKLMLDETSREKRITTSDIIPKIGRQVHDKGMKTVVIEEHRKDKSWKRHLKDLIHLS